jgi:HPr kinase/phosphorylase
VGAVPDTADLLHANVVAKDGRGLLILGPSGSGKSGLALQLMALGADLVADDQVRVWAEGGRLWGEGPETLRGRIEARGIGILHAKALARAPLMLAVELGVAPVSRLPPRAQFRLHGLDIDLVRTTHGAHVPASLLCYLAQGRAD